MGQLFSNSANDTDSNHHKTISIETHVPYEFEKETPDDDNNDNRPRSGELEERFIKGIINILSIKQFILVIIIITSIMFIIDFG